MSKKPVKKVEKVDDSGDPVPKNEVIFTLDFELYHEKGHYVKLKYTWLNKDTLEAEKLETDYLKDWEVVRRDGEEAKPETTDPPPKEDKKKAPPKDAKKGAMEEIDDPRPTVVKYTKNFEDSPLRVTEDVAKKWSDFIMRIEIYEYNREATEDKLKDTLNIDLSFFLFPLSPVQEEWEFDTLKIYSLNYLKLKITANNAMLSEFLRKKLNPLQIFILAAKDVPFKTEPKYLPIYTICKFVDGQTFRTVDYPQTDFCKWMHKHVFLVGQKDPVMFAEQLASRTLNLELHDCDEEVKDDTTPKFSYGLAKFHLKDLLNPHCFNMKLRSDVFPVKRAVLNNEDNLNLNTTAKKEERAIEKSSPYLINGTFYVISVDLAYNIGEFDEKEELAKLKPKEEEPAQPEASKIPEPEVKKDQLQPPKVEDEPEDPESEVEDIVDENAAIYERAVYIMPYENSTELLTKVYNSIETINLQGLNLENSKQLNTKEFSEEERANRKLDFLGGFELMDAEFRMIIIEGLGGKGHSMNKFYKMNQREQPNQRRLKLLYNPEIKFKNRLYWDFNASVKRIKLRDTLTLIMSSPNVFLRSKVPEEIYDTLQKLAEMRKFDRIKYLKDYDLFPTCDRLLSLERKYGDSLSHKDLYGIPQKSKRKKKQETNGMESTLMLTQQQEETMKQTQSKSTKKVQIKDDETEATGHYGGPQLKHSRTMRKTQKNDLGYTPGQSHTSRRERIEVPEGVEVYMYSGQKLNYYELEKEKIRQKVAEDKAHFYTYSPEHLSLAFPIVNENEIIQKEKELNMSKWRTKEGFHNVTKKPKEEYTLHPKKPPQDVLDDLQEPYHLQKTRKDEALKALQREERVDPNKSEFNLNIKPVYTFSEKEYFNTVFLGGDDVIKEMEEAKKAEYDQWKSKLVVDNPHFKVNTRPVRKMQQMDKRRGVLEDPPKKLGIRGHSNRLKAMAAKNIVPCPYTSVFMDERYTDPKDPLSDMKTKDQTKMRTKFGFDTNIRNDTLSYSKVSSKKFIEPLKPHEKVGPKWGKPS